MTNCKNCGAPLVNGKCRYCETEYDDQNGITLHMELGRMANVADAVTNSLLTLNETRRLYNLEEK